MADEEIAFQLMRLYRTLRGPCSDQSKEAARCEIDRLLGEFEGRRRVPPPGAGPEQARLRG